MLPLILPNLGISLKRTSRLPSLFSSIRHSRDRLGSGLTNSGRDSLLVKGRMYNVSTRHVVDPVDDFIEAAANKVMAIHYATPAVQGDVLVFMPGESHLPQLK